MSDHYDDVYLPCDDDDAGNYSDGSLSPDEYKPRFLGIFHITQQNDLYISEYVGNQSFYDC